MTKNFSIETKQEFNVIDSEYDYFGEYLCLTTAEGGILVFK